MQQRLNFPRKFIEHLLGPADVHRGKVEECLGASISVRGEEVIVKGEGPEADEAARVLEDVYNLFRQGVPVRVDDLRSALTLVRAGSTQSLSDFFQHARVTPNGRKSVFPRTPRQMEYLDHIRSDEIVFGVGPSGTGKTYLAVAMAALALADGAVKRIILTRPAVEAGEKLGFLPGDLTEKVNPYLRPLYDALYDLLERDRVAHFLESGVIEVAPLAFMRGRTLNNAFIILDEGQNTSPEQMKMFLTRLGFGSQAIITGDTTQTDIGPARSGLVEALDILQGVPGVGVVHFTDQDVVRHHMVQRIVQAYEQAARGRASKSSTEP